MQSTRKAEAEPVWIILTIILALILLVWFFFFSASIKAKMMDLVYQFFGWFR